MIEAAPDGFEEVRRYSQWTERAILGGLLAACGLWLMVSLTYPFGWDQGIFAWVGDAINRGGHPYRDAWDIKGPLAYYGYALAQWVFGHNLWGIRVLDGLLLGVAGLSLYALLRRLSSRFLAAWAALVYVAWYGSSSFWHTAQPDGWAAAAVLAAMALVLGRRGAPPFSRSFQAGLLIGCGALVKPLFCIFLAVLVCALLVLFPDNGKRRAESVFAAVAGFVMPPAATVVWFLRIGALADFVEQNLVYTATIYSPFRDGTLASVIHGLAEYARSSHALPGLCVPAALGFAVWTRKNRTLACVAGCWLAAALFCVVIQNRYFAYHWPPVFAPLIVLAAAGFDAALRPSAKPGAAAVRPLAALLSLCAVTAIICLPLRTDTLRWLRLVRGTITRDQYYAAFVTSRPEMQAAAYIHSQTNDRDRLVIWGWEAAILYMSDRRSTSRFGFPMPLLAGPASELRDRYRKEFLLALSSAPPAFVVFGTLARPLLGKDFDPKEFVAVREFVAGRCSEDRRYGHLQLYRCP